MRVAKREFYEYLKKPQPNSPEPLAKTVGIYDLSLLIARKTKFRVWDVKEVLEEVGPAIYAQLLQRKTVNLGGVNIRSKWQRLDFPRYVQGENIWQFGYFKPMIDFEKPYHMLYYGVNTVGPKGFVESIAPYMPNGEKTLEDLINSSNAAAKETAQLGKDMVVSKNNTIIYPEGSRLKKTRYFREDFHPDILERRRYHTCKSVAIARYKKGQAEGIYPNDEFPGMGSYIRNMLHEYGFDNWLVSGRDIETEDEDDILEAEEKDDA